MKTKQWIGTLFAFLLILSGCTNNRGAVERPEFIFKSFSAGGLEIEKVVLSDTTTVLYMKAFYPSLAVVRNSIFRTIFTTY